MRSRFLMCLALAVSGLAAGGPVAGAPASASAPLGGTLMIAGGHCEGGVASGTYFRMILPTGNRNGPFLANGDSTCSDQTYTPLQPGSAGGLALGTYQPQPTPAFDASGHARMSGLTAPTRFFGVDFATATNPVDPQTNTAVPAPSVTAAADGSLSGDLRAFAAAWNNQDFNQGAPKPDGSAPGNTAAPTGSFDSASGAYVLEWTSQIIGGPFDRFTGLWHLEGTYSAPGGGGSTGGGSPEPASGGDASPQQGPDAPAQAQAGSGTGSSEGAVPSSTTALGLTDATTAAGPSGGIATPGTTDAVAPIVADGREPTAWVVVLIAVVGVAAFAAFIWLDRRIRAAEVVA